MKRKPFGKGIASYDELRQVQLAELEILRDFADFCDANHLSYFLEGGTLLGAIRHKGFIPWDDDIDVSMIREDFEKFLELAPKALGDKYFVQYKTTDKNAPFLFVKLRKHNTCFLEWNKRHLKMHHGIFIDIFPYDKLPENSADEYKKEVLNLYKKFLLKNIPDRAMQPKLSLKWIIGALVRRLMHYYTKLTIDKNFDTKVIDAFKRHQYDEYENIVYTCHLTSVLKGVLNKYKYEDIFPLQSLEFEGHQFKVPCNYDSYLTQLYGDYMQLPPEEQRVGHRPAHISFNLELDKK